ncbi:hypothetical protein FRC10_005220, partial [Ceratobasidium sp. 414]
MHSDTAQPEHRTDHKELESQLMQTARLASLADFAIDRGMFDGTDVHAGTLTIGPSGTFHTPHPYSPSPPLEYNVH